MSESTRGSVLLAGFIAELRISQAEAARQLHSTPVSVLYWLRGTLRPRPEMRLVIERWSQGRVPASAWLTDGENAEVAAANPAVARPPEPAPSSSPVATEKANGDAA